MRILPLYQYNYVDLREKRNAPTFKTGLITDTVSFSAKLLSEKFMSGMEFKRKCSKLMTCFYSGTPMLNAEDIEYMKRTGVFRGSIKSFIKKTKYIHNEIMDKETIEYKIYKKIEETAKTDPNMQLVDLFNNWYKQSRNNLRKKQAPNLNQIKILGAQLPDTHIEKFFIYMAEVDRKLYDEPIKQVFSLSDFNYKILKAIEKTPNKSLQEVITSLLNTLNNEAFNKETLSLQDIKKIINIPKIYFHNGKYKYDEQYLKRFENDKTALQIEIIKQIKHELASKGYIKMEQYCEDNIKMLKGMSVRIPFGNKNFVHFLNEILHDCENTELKNEILRLASTLPKSSDSIDAMILKLKDLDADTIGDKLFSPFVATIEHLKAASLGGNNSMKNCGLAKAWINCRRGNDNVHDFLTKHNIDPKNQELYAQKLVNLNNKKILSYEDTLGQLKTIEEEALIDLNEYKSQLINFDDTKKKNNKK